jgi:uncharacterized protein (TIGR02099 family)
MKDETGKSLLHTLWLWGHRISMHFARLTWYLVVTVLVIAAAAITIFRFWLPALAERKAEVESFLSSQIGQSVVIGEMGADWTGLYPSLNARQLVLKTSDGKQDLKISLDELRLDMDIVPLLQGRLVFREITLKKPVLHVTRTEDGDIFIGEFKAPPPKKQRLAQLFRQHRVNIIDGSFSWHDQFLKEKSFVINDIQLKMNNRSRRHMLEGSLGLPGKVAEQFSVSIDVTGNISEPSTWSGVLAGRINELNLAGLPGILREIISGHHLSGIVSIDASTRLHSGVIEDASGEINGQDLVVPLGKFGKPFSVRRLQTVFKAELSGETWLVGLDNARLALAGEPWETGTINAYFSEDESSIHVSHVNLTDVRPVLDALSPKNKIVELVKDLYPSGKATDVGLTLFGPLSKPVDFHYRMSVADGSVNAYRFYPAVTGLKGDINITRKGGQIVAEGTNSRVVLDKVFDRALRVQTLQGDVEWRREADSWIVNGRRIWVKNNDAEVASRFIATIPTDRSLQPTLDIDAELINGNLTNAERYFPVHLMKPEVRKWFDDAKFRGRMNRAVLEYRGTARGFPVKGAEDFEVRANIESGSMNFAPGWPRLTGIDADLVIGRNDLWVTGSALDLYDQQVGDSKVHLSHLAEPGKQTVNVSTRLQGGLGKVIQFLQTGPLFRGSAFQQLDLEGKGNGQMRLDLSLPLADTTETRVNGEYTTGRAELKLPDGTWISSLSGKMNFTEKSITAKRLDGQMLGGPLSVDVQTIREGQPPVVRLTASGKAHASHLGPVLGDWMAKELHGESSWTGEMLFDSDIISLSARSDLSGMSSTFPYPLSKEASEKQSLKLDASFLSGGRAKLSFELPAMVTGKLYFAETDKQLSLAGGCILVAAATAACDEKPGLTVDLVQPVLDLDPWDNYIKQQEGDDGLPPVLTRMTGKIDTVFYAGVNMADISVALDRQYDDSWQGNISGARVNGEASFRLDGAERWLTARLDNLVWNEAEKETLQSDPQDPRRFPKLDLVVNNLVFHDMKLGTLMLQGEPANGAWELQLLKLDRPEMKVTAKGSWQAPGGKHSSGFEVDFTSTDMKSTLTALDFDLDFESERFRATGNVSWPGAPYQYELAILNGQLKMHSGKGRLSSVEVGAGRLLGVFNVENLLRRLLLDFSDISEQGFAFDSIDADMSIDKGVASVPKLIMPAPSATIRLEGTVGLVAKDVDIKMSISPAIGGNLAVAGFVLGGPAGGFVTLLASKAIKEQMNKSTDYQYTIRGSWEDPVVEKMQPTNPGAENQGQDNPRTEPAGLQ